MTEIIIENIKTYSDWGLFLASMELSAPNTQTIKLDVQGRNGSIDMTDFLAGEAAYNNRTLTFTFDCNVGYREWHALFAAVSNYCHGKAKRVSLSTDPNYYYYGRMSVKSGKDDDTGASIIISVDAEPFKYGWFSTVENWPWDDFNFNTDIVREYKDIAINGTKTITIVGFDRATVPTFECSDAMEVSIDGAAYQLNPGKNKNSDILIQSGENTLVINGSGTISIIYREESI